MSNTALVREIFISNPGVTYEIPAIALEVGLTNKQASDILRRLVKNGEVLKEGNGFRSAEVDYISAEEIAPAEETVVETEEDAPAPEPSKKFDLASMKDKIAKLLAKAEGTDNDEERDAFNAKAEKLMLQLGIQAAELEAAGEVRPEEIVEVVREWTGNYSIVMVPFTAQVADAFGNLNILSSKNYNGMVRRTYIIGHKTDVDSFTTLLDSLAVQAMSALRRWQKANIEERRYLTDMEKYVQHRSFLDGFGREVAKRVSAERKQEEKGISTGAEIVLASKMEKVAGWTQEKYGDLKVGKGGAQTFDAGAYRDGSTAGRDANLGGGAKGEIK